MVSVHLSVQLGAHGLVFAEHVGIKFQIQIFGGLGLLSDVCELRSGVEQRRVSPSS